MVLLALKVVPMITSQEPKNTTVFTTIYKITIVNTTKYYSVQYNTVYYLQFHLNLCILELLFYFVI